MTALMVSPFVTFTIIVYYLNWLSNLRHQTVFWAKFNFWELYYFAIQLFLCKFRITPKGITMSGQCKSKTWFLFSTLKQKMRKMYCKNHNLLWHWISLGILGCNLIVDCSCTGFLEHGGLLDKRFFSGFLILTWLLRKGWGGGGGEGGVVEDENEEEGVRMRRRSWGWWGVVDKAVQCLRWWRAGRAWSRPEPGCLESGKCAGALWCKLCGLQLTPLGQILKHYTMKCHPLSCPVVSSTFFYLSFSGSS